MLINHDELRCYKEIELSEQGKLQFFLNKHSTKEGTWGLLQLREGEIDFIFLNGAEEELARHRVNQQEPQLLIPPASWHKIVPLSDNWRASLQFYCKPQRYFSKKYGLPQIHSDLLQVYQTYLHQQEKMAVLDVGCGSGRNPLFLASLGHSVTGMDINETAMQQITEIAQKEGLTTVQTIIHDFNLPLNPAHQAYDFVYSTVTLQFLNAKRIPALLTELQQMTAPQGFHFLVFPIKAEPYIYPSSFSFLAEKDELYHFYQDCGWSILEYKETVGNLHKLDEHGKPIQGLFGFLFAQKLR
ncbi:SAM-dependent methyltransferase TehB [Legionella feeleii]|uniref:Tellurite resistance protein TehB n=1 Tax=Legionella feeleii TaxID=453 RepID=A0A0W0TMC2_9GAMM|nr:SAM-dependent methyltransferase TehB [Legionella feeleii]KTC96761.1 tellurite resistance protein TehB [Legionella feeleii]SPX60567.1 tellurite resistance protein TehB [Legionella feeleii]